MIYDFVRCGMEEGGPDGQRAGGGKGWHGIGWVRGPRGGQGVSGAGQGGPEGRVWHGRRRA